MKASDTKKLIERLFAQRMENLGYVKQKSLNSFFVKTCSDDIKIGISPRIRKEQGDWIVEFRFGVHLAILEEQLDALGGAALRIDYLPGAEWTVCKTNVNFPTSYNIIMKFQGPHERVMGDVTDNDRFTSVMTESDIAEKLDHNFEFIEKYGIPWLEKSDKQTVLNELEKPSSRGVRQLVASYLSDDIVQVENLIQTFQADPRERLPGEEAVLNQFYRNLSLACEKKRALGQDKSLARKFAREESHNKRSRLKKLLEDLCVEQLNKWGYHLHPEFSDYYIKRRSSDFVSGISPQLKSYPEFWRFDLFFANSYVPIEREIDLLDAGELRRVSGRWTISEYLDSALPDSIRFHMEFSERYKCVICRDTGFKDCPADLDEAVIVERAKSYLSLVETYCVPELEKVSDLRTVIDKLDRMGAENIRIAIAYLLAGDLDRVESIVTGTSVRRSEKSEHPVWNKLLQLCKAKRNSGQKRECP